MSAHFVSGIIGRLISADMNTTADQAIAMTVAKYIIRKIVGTNASTSLTLAAGGVYTAASKGGTAIVPASQPWSALTGSTKFIDCTLDSSTVTDTLTAATLYLSLTTGQGGAATMDLYVIGESLP